MKKSLIIISLSIILISLISINVNSFNDYEGNHDNINCHGVKKDSIEKENEGIELIFMVIVGLVFAISLSIIFICWIYLQK